jgi:hypothetical protein
MLDRADEDQALDTPQTLRDHADYASLARHAVTDNGRALIAAVCQQVEDWEARQGTRKRKRLSKAPAFARGIEGFVADLLIAIAHKERAEGWVRRSVGHDAFTDDVVTYHDFKAIRHALVGLGLVEETPAIFHCNAQSRSATRFRATARLIEMAAAHGVSLLESRVIAAIEYPNEDNAPMLGLQGRRARLALTLSKPSLPLGFDPSERTVSHVAQFARQ